MLFIHSVNAAGTAAEVRPLYEALSASRPVWALDLPGFGLSERSARRYTPRLMTDAVLAAVRRVQREHDGAAVDALAVSLGCEFLARAATEAPAAFHTLALVSPTGFNGAKRRDGPPGATREVPGLLGALSVGLWAESLYRGLTRPGVVRYFLERTWGSRAIDEALWAYDVRTVRQPGARHAPLAFLSGGLFSADTARLYEALTQPVWVAHGVRGDFVDYRQLDAMKARPQWTVQVFDAGALPHFEHPQAFLAAYEAFLAKAGLQPGPDGVTPVAPCR